MFHQPEQKTNKKQLPQSRSGTQDHVKRWHEDNPVHSASLAYAQHDSVPASAGLRADHYYEEPLGKSSKKNEVIQRQIVIGGYNDNQIIRDSEKLADDLLECMPQLIQDSGIPGYFIDRAQLLSILDELVSSEEPPKELAANGSLAQIPEEVLAEDEFSSVRYERITMAGVFRSPNEFAKSLIYFFKKRFFEEHGLLPKNENPEPQPPQDDVYIDAEHNDSALMGSYGRFPTIYSYGMASGQNEIDSNHQGPHTLAHVSVDYLMNNAAPDYNYMEQIPPPQEIEQILYTLLAINGPEDIGGKVQRYLSDYYSKYEEFITLMHHNIALQQKPNALLRELMEMHPMNVYGWRGNLTGPIDSSGKGASRNSLSGKGERYGNRLALDQGWKPVGVSSEDLKKHPLWIHMENYLLMRLSMAIRPDRLDQAVQELMNNGTYEITEEDRF